MAEQIKMTNEQLSAQAFGRQSAIFDNIYSPDSIIQYKRMRVRDQVNRYIQPGSHILELNAGTGEDAVYFARQSHYVHATDISEGMLSELSQKVQRQNLSDRVTTELRSYTDLANLEQKGPYDAIFSNFAGLNCTADLDKVLSSFNTLLKPGGTVTLVLLPPFCLWETLLIFKGKFKTAFRRSNGKNGAAAHVEGVHFRCWYYRPSFVIKTLGNDFELLGLEGLCTIVPPSYIEHFAEKHPNAYRRLVTLIQSPDSK